MPAEIDLASFVDSHADAALGRGDRRDGAPPTPDLFVQGVTTLAEHGFTEMPEAERRDVVRRLRHGEELAGLGAHGKDFIDRLLETALQGYLAHPDTWERIGFNGPAYPEGYAWIGAAEVVARHDRKAGWGQL
ncbi:MAG: gluconate 2-dehydrogenase subunit 3 family protein [Acidimicrobiia bacterium]|nr:gluconate 2-dehydrogenase subunit 3 family protein [Acidimicrobiia bacterium]